MTELVDVRQRLRGLAEQRQQDLVSTERLRERIRLTIRDAQEMGVPMTEIARLLRMDRSSVYRTYLDAAA